MNLVVSDTGFRFLHGLPSQYEGPSTIGRPLMLKAKSSASAHSQDFLTIQSTWEYYFVSVFTQSALTGSPRLRRTTGRSI